jgi:type I restriction enzyme S subunit
MFGASGRQRADLASIKDLDIPAPPLSTQHKIAAILSAYDDLIENNTRRIQILEEMAQALYREWLVEFRFPGYEKVKMVESELGMMPEGWEVKRLGDIADINASSIKKGNELKEISYIDIASVSTGQIDKIEPINFVDAPSRARRMVKHGDIIWSTVRPNRKSYSIILRPVPNLIVSTGFVVVTAKLVPYTYLYHALTTDDFVGYLTNHASGSAYPAVNSGDFNNASILLPPNNLLQSFHNIVSDTFENKQNMLEKNDSLRRTRDLLLPKLISGELDVNDLPIDVASENYQDIETGV